MAGPLSSGGCESGFALQSTLKPPRRDANCFSRRQGKPYAPAVWPAADALDVVSLVGHQLLPALLDPTSPEAVGEPYSRGTPSRRPLHSIHKTPPGFRTPRSSSLAHGRRGATGARATNRSSAASGSGSVGVLPEYSSPDEHALFYDVLCDPETPPRGPPAPRTPRRWLPTRRNLHPTFLHRVSLQRLQRVVRVGVNRFVLARGPDRCKMMAT